MVCPLKTFLKRLALGSHAAPIQCAIGLRDPQSEISATLHGIGAPRIVTDRHVVASARPFTIGISLENEDRSAVLRSQPLLEFRTRSAEKLLLGAIRLRYVDAIPIADDQLCLFQPVGCRNFCLPTVRLQSHYLYYAYTNWRSRLRTKRSSVQPVMHELHSLYVFYVCPRPVVLVSVVDRDLGNVFPMDLIGPIGNCHFSLALHSTSGGAPLIARARRAAVSSIPFEQAAVAYELGKNHKKSNVDWSSVPFATRPSTRFGLPVPQFALRVREMEIENVRTLGSYKLFVGRTVEDEVAAEGLQLHFIHGFYQAWRRENPHA